jgi:hypothetical protein
MIYYLSKLLTPYWGPFRLLESHLLLLSLGAFIAAVLALVLLPKL